jgi:hypothetical protein
MKNRKHQVTDMDLIALRDSEDPKALIATMFPDLPKKSLIPDFEDFTVTEEPSDESPIRRATGNDAMAEKYSDKSFILSDTMNWVVIRRASIDGKKRYTYLIPSYKEPGKRVRNRKGSYKRKEKAVA